jgi:hypothetical protein
MAKVHVVKDQHGRPVATFAHDPKSSNAKAEPKILEGHRVEEVEVPDNFAANLHGIYKPHGT